MAMIAGASAGLAVAAVVMAIVQVRVVKNCRWSGDDWKPTLTATFLVLPSLIVAISGRRLAKNRPI
jgi:ABC-type Fe3+ transport system permease subunit